MTTARLRAFLRKLRKDFPTRQPVRVRLKRPHLDPDGTHAHAVTYKCDGYFEIWLHPAPPDATIKESLLHEWAHVRTWKDGALDHDTRWALDYDAIRRRAKQYAELTRWIQCENEFSD